MIIKAYNETHQYLLFIDLEFNNKTLVQFAGLLFKKIDNDGIYQLYKSINQYIGTTVCYPFVEYTNITNKFLEENGITLKDLQTIVQDDLLNEVNPAELLIISHGLKNDRIILNDAGLYCLNSYKKDDEDKRVPIDGYCTFSNGRRILHRNNELKLENIANEAGYYLHHAHNAYNDVWAEVSIFTYLKKIEQQEKEGV